VAFLKHTPPRSARKRRLFLYLPVLVLSAACSDAPTTSKADAGRTLIDGGQDALDGGADALLKLPPGFPRPLFPSDNPVTKEKVELGRHLFYDQRLSANGTQSCASCHDQARAFTDGRAQSLGSTGDATPRGAMSLANVAYLSVFTWSNPLMETLEKQTLVPMFGKEPTELGLIDEASLVAVLRDVPYYQEAFPLAFPGESEVINLRQIVHAITNFERTLISGRSPYDRWIEGDENAISESAKRGYELFNGHPFECFHCHGTFTFNDSIRYEGNEDATPRFHNTGLYNIDGVGSYPEPNTGVYGITGKRIDMGAFRAPTLRNVAVTAPYMHDGSIATLSDVLDHYAAGGRTINSGPAAGVGSASPLKSDLLAGFVLSDQDRADTIAFLESLTDEQFLTDPRFENPWPASEQ
jgi:cytochrome c peroxidase